MWSEEGRHEQRKHERGDRCLRRRRGNHRAARAAPLVIDLVMSPLSRYDLLVRCGENPYRCEVVVKSQEPGPAGQVSRSAKNVDNALAYNCAAQQSIRSE